MDMALTLIWRWEPNLLPACQDQPEPAVPSLPLGTWPHPLPFPWRGVGRRQMEVERAPDSGRRVCGAVWKTDLACSGCGPWPLPFKGRGGESSPSITRVIKLVLAQPACLPGIRGRGTPVPPTPPAPSLPGLSASCGGLSIFLIFAQGSLAWTCFVSLPGTHTRKVTHGRSLAQPQEGEIPRLPCQPCPATLPACDTLPRPLPRHDSPAWPSFQIHWQWRPLPEHAVGEQVPVGFGAAAPKVQWRSWLPETRKAEPSSEPRRRNKIRCRG